MLLILLTLPFLVYSEEGAWGNCPDTLDELPELASVIAKGLMIFLIDPPTSPVTKMEMLDIISFYFVTDDCNRYEDSFSGEKIIVIANKIDPNIGYYILLPSGDCSDGTLNATCSTSKPLYCLDGLLAPGCNTYSCGCDVGSTCNTGTDQCEGYAQDSSFIVRDGAGNNVAIFDKNGDIGINGTCTIGACSPPADETLIFPSLAYINNKGDLCLSAGDCTGNDADCNSPGDNSFIIKAPDGTTVAYINSTGELCLIGDLVANANLS